MRFRWWWLIAALRPKLDDGYHPCGRQSKAPCRVGRQGLLLSAAGGILSRGNEETLASNPKWESSRFGALESFILDYLVGGKSAGESVRLKLQSPLFVADALLDAARQQLEDDLTTAEQVRRARVSPVTKHRNIYHILIGFRVHISLFARHDDSTFKTNLG